MNSERRQQILHIGQRICWRLLRLSPITLHRPPQEHASVSSAAHSPQAPRVPSTPPKTVPLPVRTISPAAGKPWLGTVLDAYYAPGYMVVRCVEPGETPGMVAGHDYLVLSRFVGD